MFPCNTYEQYFFYFLTFLVLDGLNVFLSLKVKYIFIAIIANFLADYTFFEICQYIERFPVGTVVMLVALIITSKNPPDVLLYISHSNPQKYGYWVLLLALL